MQFSQGRSEFQELYLRCPSAPPLGVDRFLAPRQTPRSGLRLLVSAERKRSMRAAVTTIGHTPCVWGSSLKPGWSPAGSRGRHGCLLVRQAQGLGGSPFLQPGSSLPAQAHLCECWGFQGQPFSVLLSPPHHSFSFQKPGAWAPAFSREDRHPKKGQRQVLFFPWAALLGASFAG